MLSKDDFRTLVSNWNYKTINQKYNIVESLENSNYTDSITINKLIQKYSGEDVLESILEFESQNEQTGGKVPDVSARFDKFKVGLSNEYKKDGKKYQELETKAQKNFDQSQIGKNLKTMQKKVDDTINNIQEEYKKIAAAREEGNTSNKELEKQKQDLEKQIEELNNQMNKFEKIYREAEEEKREKEITEDIKNKLIDDINDKLKQSMNDIEEARNQLPNVTKTAMATSKAVSKFKKTASTTSPPNTALVKQNVGNTNVQDNPSPPTVSPTQPKIPSIPTSTTSTESPKKNLDKSWPKGINKSGNALLNKYKGTMSRADRRKINKLCNECGVNRAKNGEWCKWCEKKPKVNEKYYSDTESDVLESVFRRMGV